MARVPIEHPDDAHGAGRALAPWRARLLTLLALVATMPPVLLALRRLARRPARSGRTGALARPTPRRFCQGVLNYRAWLLAHGRLAPEQTALQPTFERVAGWGAARQLLRFLARRIWDLREPAAVEVAQDLAAAWSRTRTRRALCAWADWRPGDPAIDADPATGLLVRRRATIPKYSR